MTTVIGADLDRTLIYSRGAVERYGDAGRALVAVERYRDADASWMTAAAASLLAHLPASQAVLVPVTTRTPEQWQRVQLPGAPPQYVITANGGVLLVDGVVDEHWSAAVRQRLAGVAGLAEVLIHARTVCRPEWTVSVREASGLFCYAVLDRPRIPAELVGATAQWAAERGWRVSLQGRKLYWVPASLTKSAALTEVIRRTGATSSLAAGDSLLDADLLLAADAGIAARHGELVASGWSAPTVRVTDSAGVLAGEEIVRWCVGQVAAVRA